MSSVTHTCVLPSLVCCIGFFQLHCTKVLIQSDCYDTLGSRPSEKQKLNNHWPSERRELLSEFVNDADQSSSLILVDGSEYQAMS